MLRTRIAATLIPLLALGLAACEVEQQEQPAADQIETEAPPAETPAPETETALGVDTLDGVGPYLTDADGRALYLFTADTAGQSTCYDDCAEEWPPFLAEDATPATARAPVNEEMLGTTQRRTGEVQVTYNDWPLYYYAPDRMPGQTTGQDVESFGGEWYLVHPEGHELEDEQADTAENGDDEMMEG